MSYFKSILKESYIVKLKKDNSFSKLTDCQKLDVLQFIEMNDLNYAFYKEKGYDPLSKSFYAIKWIPSNKFAESVTTKKLTFSSFDSYFEVLKDEIYNNACYLGYVFSESIIDKYGLNLQKLLQKTHFDNRTLSSLKFKDKSKQKPKAASIKTTDKLQTWANNLPDSCDLSTAIKIYKDFAKQFKTYWAKFLLLDVFEMKYEKDFFSIVSDFLVETGLFETFKTFHWLSRYGAIPVINALDKLLSTGKISVKAYSFRKNIVQDFRHHEIRKSRQKSGYNVDLNLYQVVNRYTYRFEVFDDIHSFLSFSEFKKYCAFDLSKSNLICAPITEADVSDCVINDQTKLPFNSGFDSVEIIKEYTRGVFKVTKKWLNKNGEVLQKSSLASEFFCDFLFYTHNDISNADLVMCDGIENLINLENIKYENIKVRSDVAISLGLPQDEHINFEAPISFCTSQQNELVTIQNYEIERIPEEEDDCSFSYVSDIHLDHRILVNKCKTENDIRYLLNKIVDNIDREGSFYIVICGDITSDPVLYSSFINLLSKTKHEYFITLGNHELWSYKGKTFEEIARDYSLILDKPNIHFLNNNMFLMKRAHSLSEIDSNMLNQMDEEELYRTTRDSNMVLFGGIGFSGSNQEFNANNGIYRQTISHHQEIRLSEEFEKLYRKVANALKNRNVFILTHMPLEDWSSDKEHKPKFVYISGHNHRNYFFDNGIKRIYSDNQIGYHQKDVHLKKVYFNTDYDYFTKYTDGIYEITRNDYINFYRGLNEQISFNRDFKKIFMIKKRKTYMFLAKTQKDRMCILNGGSVRKAVIEDLSFYYDNLDAYSDVMNKFLNKYFTHQKEISKTVKDLGGSGRIHGAIVDIDFYNHLYINPLDGSITCYMAYSMTDKYVYDNFGSLITYSCPNLLPKYKKVVNDTSNKTGEFYLVKPGETITNKHVYVDDTTMYRVSRILKGLQFNATHKVVKIWNDSIINDVDGEGGKLIVRNLIEHK